MSIFCRGIKAWGIVALLALCGSAQAALPPSFIDQLVGQFTQSLFVKKLPSGKLLVGEKDGTIFLIDPSVVPATRTVFIDIPNVDKNGEKGLLNLALDPNFASNQFFYVYYHNAQRDRARVSRFTSSGNTASVASEVLVWEDLLPTSLQIISDHWGGGLGFGPDGYLYLTIGDKKDNPEDAQDLTLAAGKIIRLDTAGLSIGGAWVPGALNSHLIPPTNPFRDGPGGNLDEIWALGLRNPFRAQWDPVTGKLLIAEVGGNIQSGADASYEDLHAVGVDGAGTNFGWPACEGPNCVGTPPANYSPPVFTVQHVDSRALMVGPTYSAGKFPAAYDGAVFLCDYTRGWLRYIFLKPDGSLADGVPSGGHPFTGPGDVGSCVDMEVGADGALYYVRIVPGELRRVVYQDPNNQAPIILNASGTPTQAINAPLTVNFSALAADPEGQNLTYTWQFGDGTTSTSANTSHTYLLQGEFHAVLYVSDGVWTVASDPIRIEIGNTFNVVFLEPDSADLFRAGETLNIKAAVANAAMSFSNSQFSWSLEFLHDDHFHPILSNVPGTACAAPAISCMQFQIPVHGHDFSGLTGFRFRVRVNDNFGLVRSQDLFLYPEKVTLNVSTNILGADTIVHFDQLPRTLPISLDTMIGFEHSLTAPATRVINGNIYEFTGWSNGDTNRTIHFQVPDHNYNLEAQYRFIGTATRVQEGLQALYTFDANADNTVADVSQVETPLNLTVADAGAVEWGTGTLTIKSPTRLISDTAAGKINNAVQASNAFTAEAWIKPDSASLVSAASILNLSSGLFDKNLALEHGDITRQPASVYSARVRTTSASENSAAAFISTSVGSVTNKLTHLVLTRDPSGLTRLYLDGRLITQTSIAGNTGNWDSSFKLLLANDFSSDRPWLGTYDMVAIYSQALSAEQVLQNFYAGSGSVQPSDDDVPTILVTAPRGGEIFTTDTISLIYSITGEGFDHLHVSVDGGAHTPVTDLTGNYIISGLTSGAHTVTLQLVDAAHTPLTNPEAVASVSFGISLPADNGVTLPAKIEAEAFTDYFDRTAGNNLDPACGTTDMDVEPTGDIGGGCNIGSTQSGEWTEYKIYSEQNAVYVFSVRAATASNSIRLHLEVDGVNVSGNIPITSGQWQVYGDYPVEAPLTAGPHKLRVVYDTGKVNVNYIGIQLKSVVTNPPVDPEDPPADPEDPPVDPPTNPNGVALPARIEAEAFTDFRDLTAGNNLNPACGTSDVDLELTGDVGGGCNIGSTQSGEWTEYTVYSAQNAIYVASVRAATASSNIRIHLEVDGVNVSGAIPITRGNWQVYGNYPVEIPLSAGTHKLRLVYDNGKVNVNYMDVQLKNVVVDPPADPEDPPVDPEDPPVDPDPPVDSPTNPNGVTLPARIEAEAFTDFRDLSTGNSLNPACGTSDVDAELTGDVGGGCNIGSTQSGEWTEYTVYSAQNAVYVASVRAATASSNIRIHLEVDGVNVSGAIPITSGQWQVYGNYPVEIPLSAGTHKLRLVYDTGRVNVNYMDVHLKNVVVDPPVDTEDPPVDPEDPPIEPDPPVDPPANPDGVLLPARIEAEAFTAFSDTTAGNSGAASCGSTDVDVEPTGDVDGVCNIGSTKAGEWTEYKVVSPQDAAYTLSLRTATIRTNIRINVEVDGILRGTVNIPITGGWQTYASVPMSLPLSSGNHTIRLVYTNGNVNINYLTLTP